MSCDVCRDCCDVCQRSCVCETCEHCQALGELVYLCGRCGECPVYGCRCAADELAEGDHERDECDRDVSEGASDAVS